MEDFLQSKYC